MLVSQPEYLRNLSFAAVVEATEISSISLAMTASQGFLFTFFRFLLGFIMLMSTWFILNIIRLIQEKREIIKKEEREAYEQFKFVQNIYNNMLEHVKNARQISAGSLVKRRKSLLLRKRRRVVGIKSSVLWNKMHQLRPVVWCEEDNVYPKKRFAEQVNDQQYTQKDLSVSSSTVTTSSEQELCAFVPQLRSTTIEEKLLTHEDATLNSKYFPYADHISQNHPYTMGMLKSPEISLDMYDPHPGLLAPSQVPFHGNDNFQTSSMFGMAPSAKMNQGLWENHCLNIDSGNQLQSIRDSGYQDSNGSTNLFSSIESKIATELWKEVERYNQLKEAELCARIDKAQKEAKREGDEMKSMFRLPPENVEFTKAQIYDCPELQKRKQLLLQIRQEIDDVKNEMKAAHERAFDIRMSKSKLKQDASTIKKRSILWQRKQEERMCKAKSGIIRAVKSTMETRFRGMVNLKQQAVAFDGKNWCYDCATKRHQQYFIDGVDGCPVEEGPKILLESDGFNPNCSVVKVINSWYKSFVEGKYNSTQHKADEMDKLLKRVLKEMYLKRYYERGQLISQTYLTVSPHLHKFVFKSPKESIPLSYY